MWLNNLRQMLFGSPPRQAGRPRRRATARLQVETLEDRTLPAVTLGQVGLNFEPNQGQTDPAVNFLTRGHDFRAFLTPGAAVLQLTQPVTSSPTTGLAGNVLPVQLVGSNPTAQAVAEDALAATTNYLAGSDPSKWLTNIPNFGRVEYQNVYSGVNLVYSGTQQQLGYEFIVSPGADPGVIQLGFQSAQGLNVDPQGNLVVSTLGGNLVESAPTLYQDVNGARQAISGQFVLEGNNQVGFAVGPYDLSQPLVINSALSYSPNPGGGVIAVSNAIAVDSSGNSYVTGFTLSPDFPKLDSTGATNAFNEIYVAKLNANGTDLVYSTYLSAGYGYGIAVDAAGDAYVTGLSNGNLPTVTPFQAASTDNNDAFVAKLNPDGNGLIYASYLGGSSYDIGQGIAVDSSGSAYVTGMTTSADFPTASAPGTTPFQATYGGTNDFAAPNVPGDAFVAKITPDGSALAYATYLGGNEEDAGYGIAVDNAGNAYVTGATYSGNFPTVNANWRSQLNHGGEDAFVSKLNAGGTALVYSTYLGGQFNDFGSAIAVDAAGQAYVTGTTFTGTPAANPFPTTNHTLESLPGQISRGAFLTELDPSGGSFVSSSLLGGNGETNGTGIALDTNGTVYVTGATTATDLPTPDVPNGYAGGEAAFVLRLQPGPAYSGSIQELSLTFLGGSNSAGAAGIAVDNSGNAYVTGFTSAPDFPTANPFPPASVGGFGAAFIAKVLPPELAPISNIGTGSLSVVENAPTGTTVGLTAHSGDSAGATVTYSLTYDSTGGGFAIDPSTGVVSVADGSKLDTETGPFPGLFPPPPTASITVLASVPSSQGVVQKFTISISDAPLAPISNIGSGSLSVAAGAPTGTSVGLTARSSDPTGESVYYALLNDSTGGGFAIDPSTGVVTVADGAKPVNGTSARLTVAAAEVPLIIVNGQFVPLPGEDINQIVAQSFTIAISNSNPVPILTSLDSAATSEGHADLTLTVNGSSFISGSVVQWNGTPLATTFVNPTQLTAVIPAADLAEEGTATVTVVNPSPGGGTSAGLTFTINDATLTAGTFTPPVATEGVGFSDKVVFNFSDADPGKQVSDYSAQVTLGDGTSVTLTSTPSSNGRIVDHGDGTFDVQLSYTYAEEVSNNTFSVTVTDAGGGSTSASTSTFSVADAALTGFYKAPVAKEGVGFSNAVVFNFSDADPGKQVGDYSALVTLGDGTSVTLTSAPSSNGQIVDHGDGTFDVQLSYTYAEELTGQTFSVVVTDNQSQASGSTSSFSVADAPLTDTSTPPSVQPSATAGTSTNTLTVATFTDANAGDHTGDFTAAIHWGDGKDSAGTVSYDSSTGAYSVTGSHVYTVPNSSGYLVTADVSDDGGSKLVGYGKTTVTVTPATQATSTTLIAPVITYGANGVVTVTVSAQTGTPTGNVALTVDGASPITQALSGGSSIFTLTGLHAGNHSLSASYAAQGFFLASSATGTLTVTQADPSIKINSYSGVYDGTAHGITGSATGVNGEDLSSLLNLGPMYVNAGHYTVNWSFAGNNDYKSAGGSRSVDIGGTGLPVSVTSDLMLANSQGDDQEERCGDGRVPPLTGTVNGSMFTGSTTFTTAQGDTLTITLSSTVTATSPVGVYPIIATVTGPGSANYVLPPAGNMYVVTIGHDAGSGAKQVSFWDNKGNAKAITMNDLAALDALNLRNDNGSNFDPSTASQLQTWLRSDADRILTVLSVQLAVMDLNVQSGYVKTTDVVYAGNLLQFAGSSFSVTGLDGGGFLTVGNLMTLANNALMNARPTGNGDDEYDRWSNYLNVLEDALEAANKNTSFVQQSVPGGV
jgi:hypothetical protein